MSHHSLTAGVLAVLSVAAFVACSDEAPVAPSDPHQMGNVTGTTLDPFTFRAPLEPYHINQAPNLTILSRATTDIVMQRSVFAPGPGMWHTHPGPSYVYVIEGQIKLDRYIPREGCTETPVFTPGQAYMEIADQVHRAVVVSAEPAVVLVTRLNIPVGGMITVPAADPGC